MAMQTLGSALEREHRDIDGGIEDFTASLEAGTNDTSPLLRAMAGLRRHIYLEEVFLFPPMREAGMVMPILVMLREHGELWRAMDSLDTLLAEETDAPTVLEACRDLLALLDAHNSKEEPIIYTRADDLLAADASAELHEFLEAGTTPDGWVCERATADAARGPNPFANRGFEDG